MNVYESQNVTSIQNQHKLFFILLQVNRVLCDTMDLSQQRNGHIPEG